MTFRKGQLLYVRSLQSTVPAMFSTVWRISSIRSGHLYLRTDKDMGKRKQPAQPLALSTAQHWIRDGLVWIGGVQ